MSPKTTRPTDQHKSAMDRLLQIRPRFMRSVHLERDISDASSSQGYILTPVAHNAITRICGSFYGNSTQRAFRVAGALPLRPNDSEHQSANSHT